MKTGSNRMISTYDLDMLTPPCDPGSARLVAKARLAVDIAPVLPYLNATLPGASYMPEAESLTWKDDGHTVAFHPREIAVSDVEDRGDAEQVIGDLVDLVNRTWQRRGDIVPSVATRRRPTPMAVYGLLPGTNCKECGLPGCWQFALKLVAGEAKTGECPELAQAEFVSGLAELRSLVGETA
jgi:ArsR family metal-binding transcriptional regulator